MKKKSVLAAAMAGVMCMGLLAGCGSKDGGTADDAFKIGVIGPLTGDAAIYGNAVKNGAQIAVDEINAQGGDIKLALKAEDDVSAADTSVNAYNSLKDWGMQVLVGPTTSTPSAAVASEAYADRLFMITPSGSATTVTEGKDNVFQVCFTDPNQGTAAADYIAENMPDSKIAIIYQNDIDYSQGIRNTFAAEAAAKGLEIVSEGTFTADTATDFSVQLTAAQSKGADLLFLPIYYQEASVILNQAKTMGFAPTVFGVDGMDGILTLKGFDTSLAEGVMLLTPFSADATDEKTQNFVTEYKDRFGEIPNQFAADAYDAVYIVYEGLKAAGCTTDMSYEDICEALVSQITTMNFDGLTGADMTWKATGEVSKAPMAVVIKDGAYVLP